MFNAEMFNKNKNKKNVTSNYHHKLKTMAIRKIYIQRRWIKLNKLNEFS